MRLRILTLALLATVLAALAGCAAAPAAPAPVAVVTKTPRPTFTPTTVPPTATRVVPSATPLPTATTMPTPTAAPPTPTPEPVKAMLTATDVTNVRSGPGVAFAKIGQLTAGKQYEITGKNPGGDWWQFNFDSQTAWVASSLVTANDAAATVAVAANLPVAPTAAPAPQPVAQAPAAPPAAAAPPPAPTKPFVAQEVAPWPNTNDRLTVRCRVSSDMATGIAGAMKLTGPASGQVSFGGGPLVWANTGMARSMQYVYNDGCKLELSPFTPGNYTAVLVDGGGNPISDPLTFTADGDTREFQLVWRPR